MTRDELIARLDSYRKDTAKRDKNLRRLPNEVLRRIAIDPATGEERQGFAYYHAVKEYQRRIENGLLKPEGRSAYEKATLRGIRQM